MNKSRIFRQVALDRLSSPEQLDQTIRITSSGGWLSLSAVGLVLLSAIVWGFVGRLSEKVAGSGILIRSGGVLEVVAQAGGRVTDVPVRVGDTIREGQVVCWIAQPDLLERLNQAREAIERLRAEHQDAVGFATEDARLQRESLEQQRRDHEQSIQADRARLESLAARRESQEQVVDRGLLPRTALLSTQNEIDLTEQMIRRSETQLAQISVQKLAISNRFQETLRGGEQLLTRAQAELAQAERGLNARSQVASLYGGRVLEILTEPGQIVGAGEPVLSLDLEGNAIQELVAVIYVSSIDGKKIKPGMEIHIAPSTVAEEDYGMMVGNVTFASSFPATPRGMQRVLKNESLTQTLSGGGAPYEIHAELRVASDTFSQYRWTSSGGPPTKIQSGTLARALITVDTQRPVSRVIPLLKRWTGISGL
jgi:HlyD family secretion protein